MQHGNSATRLMPQHVFQVTGKLFKGLEGLIVGLHFDSQFTPDSIFIRSKERISTWIANTGLLMFTVSLGLMQLILHSLVQTCCISVNELSQNKYSYKIDTKNDEYTSSGSHNEPNRKFQLRYLGHSTQKISKFLIRRNIQQR